MESPTCAYGVGDESTQHNAENSRNIIRKWRLDSLFPEGMASEQRKAVHNHVS